MGYGYGHSAAMGSMGMGGGAAVFQFIFGILFFIILASLAIILVRFALRGGRRGMWMHSNMMQHGSSMEVLKERYAKGEIDRTEFEQKKKDLMS